MQPLIFLKDPMVFKLLHIAPWLCVCAVAPWLLQVCYFFIKTTAICFSDSLTFFLPFSVLLLHQFILLLEDCQSVGPNSPALKSISEIFLARSLKPRASGRLRTPLRQTQSRHIQKKASTSEMRLALQCVGPWIFVYEMQYMDFYGRLLGAREHESSRSAGRPYPCMFSSCSFFREVVLHPAMTGAAAKYVSCSGVSGKGSASCPHSAGMGSASGLWGHTLCFVLLY